MNNPELFRHTNLASRMTRIKFLEEFKSKISWRSDGKDSLLDIGCAGGDITTENIQTIMPTTFSRLVGVDINRKMVDYANEKFANSKISFSLLDIGGDVSEFSMANEPFDHITSLNCLHLVPDQKLAFENIFNLLSPTGDCLLYTIVEAPNFCAYKKMIDLWPEYMEDVDDFVSYFYKRVNPEYMMKKLLRNAGFKECVVELRHQQFTYDDMAAFEDASRSIVPFYSRIPADKRAEFMRQYIDQIMEFISIGNDKVTIGCKILIAYASK